MKRLFLAGLTVCFLAACQDAPLPTDSPEAPLFIKAGKKAPQAQINALIKQIFPKPWSPWHDLKSQLFDAVGADDFDAAIAPATALINGARAQDGVSDELKQEFIDVITAFAQLPTVDLSGLGPNTGLGFVTPTQGGVITSDPGLGDDLGFAVATFLTGDAPTPLAVIVESPQDFVGDCLPSADVGAQVEGCSPMSTVPEVEEFVNEIVIAVCLDFADPNAEDATLHRANAETVELEPAASPPELVEDCNQTFASENASWLMNVARAGWKKVGRPLVSLLNPEPLQASVMTVGESGSLGGRTKNFSNFGWAVPLAEGPDLIIESIVVSPASPTSDDALSFTVTVTNIGDQTAGESELLFEIEETEYSETEFSIFITVDPLDPEESAVILIDECGVECSIFLSAGDYLARARADAPVEGFDQVDESDETNNELEEEFTVAQGEECCD